MLTWEMEGLLDLFGIYVVVERREDEQGTIWRTGILGTQLISEADTRRESLRKLADAMCGIAQYVRGEGRRGPRGS
jgi:hypothetical protein